MKNYQITPLGAALVEVMPDKAKQKSIINDFKVRKQCPVSAIFTAEEIVTFYEGKIKPV